MKKTEFSLLRESTRAEDVDAEGLEEEVNKKREFQIQGRESEE